MDYIMCFFYKYGLVAICLIILIEYACFPISSEIVLPFSGVIAYINNMNIYVLVALSIIAGGAGSSICYVLGRIYGEKSLEWIESKLPRSSDAIHKSKMFFNKYGNIAVMIGRVIPLCRTYISFIAGAFKQSFGSFLCYSLIGIAVWNTVLISVGYLLGDNWIIVSEWYSKYKIVIFAIIVICVISRVITGTFKKKNGENF